MGGLIFVLLNLGVVLVVCIAAEYVSPLHKYRLRDRLPGLYLWLFMPAFGVLLAPAFRAIMGAIGIKPLFEIQGWPTAALIVAAVVTKDFFNYWQHRFDHRFVWPVHAVHHSARELHAANGFPHPFQAFSEFVLIAVPMAIIGLGWVVYPVAVTITAGLQSVIIHSPTRVNYGPLRRVFVDNRFHRIHHSLEERHFGKNYGTIFSIWDQLFGTAYFPRDDEWPDVGLSGFEPPSGVFSFLLHPLRHFRYKPIGRESPASS